jgi:glutamyl-tRNA reductase
MTGGVDIVALGVDHVREPVAIREPILVAWDGCVSDLVASGAALSGVSLRTCLRAEAYLATETPAACVHGLAAMLSTQSPLSASELETTLAPRRGRSGVAHLFSVAAGLESVIIGERQVLDQVRAAWESARARGPLDARIDRLFQHAVATGRRVRRDTGIGRNRGSLADAVADIVAVGFGDPGAATVTVVGAGKVARGTALALGRRGAHRFVVVNRSAAPARAVADELRAHGWSCAVVAWPGLAPAIAEADVIVCATSAKGHVVSTRELEGERRRMVVDLALPRDVDPEVARLPGTELVDLDRVWRQAPARPAPPAAEVARARAMVATRAEEYMRWIAEREAAPAIAALMGTAERAGFRSHPDTRRALHRQTLALKRRAFERAAR